MTPSISIEAGKDLDLAVATALGAVHLGDIGGCFGVHTWAFPFDLPERYWERNPELWRSGGAQGWLATQVGYPPLFSTDWNDAIWAAEHHPLVDSVHIERTKNRDWYANIGGYCESAATGPLAICGALLKRANSAD